MNPASQTAKSAGPEAKATPAAAAATESDALGKELAEQ
jgi:hypothetical protein